ncbi:shTK domain protein [Necator americanus]|uniref:ShTK domain protein n=1 Tax=Necator americanus TaxID=51031 RepID=W2TAH8_NECAM|nr:shTK domain protein [Necator americanus]ETN78599.1 shTK domain protein [Necator americanus]
MAMILSVLLYALFVFEALAGQIDSDLNCTYGGVGANAKTAARDEDLVQAAISTCPRTCGYCCLTPEYNCQNKQYPRIRCEFITRVMCNDPFWRNIIQEDCPNKCGFCNTGNCTDLIPNCAKDISICRNVDMQAFVKFPLIVDRIRSKSLSLLNVKNMQN